MIKTAIATIVLAISLTATSQAAKREHCNGKNYSNCKLENVQNRTCGTKVPNKVVYAPAPAPVLRPDNHPAYRHPSLHRPGFLTRLISWIRSF